MGKIMMCGSFKGGVGKTASSWNLAYCLAEMGKKVLAVDFDSQANLSTCFGIEDPAAVPLTIGHLMMSQLEDEEVPESAEFIQKRNGVDFIPSSMMLSAVDSRLRMEILACPTSMVMVTGISKIASNFLRSSRESGALLLVGSSKCSNSAVFKSPIPSEVGRPLLQSVFSISDINGGSLGSQCSC